MATARPGPAPAAPRERALRGKRGGRRHGAAVPLDEELVALRRGQQRYLREAAAGLVDPGVEQGGELRRQAGHRGVVEQVGVVVEGAAEVLLDLEQVDHQ